MSELKKSNLDKLYKRFIVKSKDITIAKSSKERSDIISQLTELISGITIQHYFNININNSTLEQEIEKCKIKFRKRIAEDEFYFYRYKIKTEDEFVREELYNNLFADHLKTYLLEKYKPTAEKSNEVLLCEMKLNFYALSRNFYAFYFNDNEQLCFDYVSHNNSRRLGTFEEVKREVKTLSSTTSLDAIKTMVQHYREEEKNNKKEKEQRWERTEKERVKTDKIKELSSKAIISRLKSLLEEKNISFYIDDRTYILKIFLKMKKGRTMVKVPKKDIKDRLEILPSLCEIIVEADQLNIHCKYKQGI